MLAYLQQLQRQTQAIQQEKEGSATAESPGNSPTFKPLDQQIVELLRSLPPTLRDRPWAIQDLVNRLEGRYRQRPHAQGVGQALRRLGWTRIRPEDVTGQGHRLWVPPNTSK